MQPNPDFEDESPSVPLTKSEVRSIAISLEMNDEPILFILLDQDGTVHRMGSATEDSVGGKNHMGESDQKLFEAFMDKIDEEMLSHCGAFEDPDIKGHKCKSTLFFKNKDKSKNAAFQFTYGSESAGPPRMISSLVMHAINLTEDWYSAQRGS